MAKKKSKKAKKQKCQAETWICSNEIVRKYGVNGSEKEGLYFSMCAACCVYLRKGGTKLTPKGG